MTPEEREYAVRMGILRVLQNVSSFLMPEASLLGAVRLEVKPTPTAVEFYAALRDLEAKQMVLGVRPAVGGPPKWKLGELGAAALAEG